MNSWSFWNVSRIPGSFWFRVWGIGLIVQDRRQWAPLFSERNGFRRYWYVGHWKVRILWP
jgi:hypothetical protein